MSSLIEGVKINGEEYNLKSKIKLIYIDPPFATGADFSFKVGMPDEWKSVADKNEIVKAPFILEELAYRDMWGEMLGLKAKKVYEKEGEYEIVVKITDILGGETSKAVKVVAR